MIIEYFAIGIIIVCIGIILYIISKKFPILSSINVESLKKYRHERIKKGLIEDRLKRKFRLLKLKKIKNGNDVNKKSPILEKFYKYVKNVELKYKEKVHTENPQAEDNEKSKMIIVEDAKKFADEEKFKEAEDKYIEAISLDSKFIAAYKGLAEVYVEMKDYDHAKEIYKYILKMNIEDDSTDDSLGKIASPEGDAKTAEKDYLKTISLNNEAASYHVDLGEVYITTGEYDKALKCFQEALKLEPNNPRNLDAIIEVAIKMEDKELAHNYFKKLKEVNPENEKLEEIANKIKDINN